MKSQSKLLGQASATLAFLLTAGAWCATASAATHIYMMTNQVTGNNVLDYVRNTDGTLTFSASVSTGGTGSGVFLNSSGPVALDATKQFLFVVNAGDNTVSSFIIGASGPTLVSHVSSAGTYPVSVASRNHRVYVLKQGNASVIGSVSGF